MVNKADEEVIKELIETLTQRRDVFQNISITLSKLISEAKAALD